MDSEIHCAVILEVNRFSISSSNIKANLRVILAMTEHSSHVQFCRIKFSWRHAKANDIDPPTFGSRVLLVDNRESDSVLARTKPTQTRRDPRDHGHCPFPTRLRSNLAAAPPRRHRQAVAFAASVARARGAVRLGDDVLELFDR